MMNRNSRSWLDRVARRAKPESAHALTERAGQGPSLSAGQRRRTAAWGGLETLEPRVLLAADHPSLNPDSFPMQNASDMMIDPGTGRAALDGIIQAPGTTGIHGTVPATGDDDMFRFVAPAGANFVSILADTVNVMGGSDLDSRVRVYSSTGDLIATGTNNGVISTTRPGVATDGWLGFIATPSETYYVQVTGESGTLGGYTLRVNAQTVTLTATTAPTPAPPDPNAPFGMTAGEALIPGVLDNEDLPDPPDPDAQKIDFPQDERIYRITAPDSLEFDSLATASARSDRDPATRPDGGFLDTHLEVYDSEGNEIATDIEAGFLNDAFVTWRAQPGETYYIRVRGDDLRDPDLFPSVGAFQLRLDLSAKDIPIDPVTRRGMLSDNVEDDPSANLINNEADTGLFRFTAQGTGTSYITVKDVGFPPHDIAARVFNFDGTFRAFSNDFNGNDAQVSIPVVGGETYFIVVDGFPDAGGGAFEIWIEAHHTTNTNTPVDDHVDRPILVETAAQFRRQIDLATPLRFGDPFLFTDSDGLGARNPILDRTYAQTALAQGRIHAAGDSDLFQFTPPVDMLSNYPGNNDDVGAALFAGGAFTTTDPDSLWARTAGAMGIWDAGDWWFSGRQGTGPDMNEYGFLPGSDIYALREFDPDGAAGPLPSLMFVGGDFNLNVPDPLGGPPITIVNLAAWGFNPFSGVYEWFSVGDPDAAVRAMAVYTNPDTELQGLVLGGDFDNFAGAGVAADKLAVLHETGALEQLGGGLGLGADASVKALAVWDPTDPGAGREANPDEGLTAVADPEDPPSTLFIGGADLAGATPTAILRQWDGAQYGNVVYASGPGGIVTAPPAIAGVPGLGSSINAMTVYTAIDPDGEGGIPTPEPTLIVAGLFASINGVASPNIIKFGRVASNELDVPDPFTDPEVQNYQPRLLWEAIPGGTGGVVHALAVWDQPDVFGSGDDAIPPLLVIGGEFTTVAGGAGPVSNLVLSDGFFFGDLGGGVDGPVFALTISRTAAGVADDQEPGIALLGVDDPQEVLYVGGNFQNADPNNPFGPTPAANVVQRSWVITPQGPAPTWTALNSGTDAPVFALQMFDDQNPAVDNSELEWDRNDRTATRMNIVLQAAPDAFLNSGLRIFDSNFNLVYPTAADGFYNVQPPDPDGGGPLPVPPPANNRILPPPAGPDPGGMVDPSIGGPGGIAEVVGIRLWGGETYYIEVISLGGTGRYDLSVTIDALPPDLDGDGQPDSPVAVGWTEVVDEGNFPTAPDLPRSLATGDTNNFTALPNTAFNSRVNKVHPSGFQTQHLNELAAIEEIEDTDLYSFIAEESGWVEVRLNTIQLRSDPLDPQDGDGDSFMERTFNLTDGTVEDAEEFKVYNSSLDGLLRIFNNDFEEVTFSDSFAGVDGEFDVRYAGTFQRIFRERDGRVVFRVERGQKYFVQVESGQKAVFEQDPDLVDWRYAIGSYELLLNTMPFLNFDDDHENYAGFGFVDQAAFFPTPIPVGAREPELLGESPNGRGSVTGVIDNTVENPDDNDAFFFIAPASGVNTATITATGSPAGLRATIQVLDDLGRNVAQGATDGNGVGTVTWVATQGDVFFIVIDGSGATEGTYRLDVVGNPYLDDHAEAHQWINATELPLRRFFGTATATGTLESPADTDLFYFDAEAYEIATVTVDSTSATLNPVVRIFEVSVDGAGNEIFLQINLNDDAAGLGVDSRATFSVTPERRYYILVEGSDIDEDFGAYTVVVGVEPTDDHPDIADLPLATPIDIDYDGNLGIGTGTESGELEREADSDLFLFVAPANGDAEITVTSTSDPFPILVQVRDSAGTVIASDSSASGTVVLNVLGLLVTGQQYFISVEADGAADTGTYSVAVVTSPTDDHADAGEFGSATQIPLSPSSGLGSRTGTIVPFTDADLFYFETIGPGQVVVEITTPTSGLDPQVTIYNDASPTPQQIHFATGTNDLVIVSFTATAANQRFYILVGPDAAAVPGTLTGAYTVRVTNTVDTGGGPGDPDDHANQGDFDNASGIGLETRTGDGSRTGVISFLGDTDLFVFSTIAAGPVRVHVTTPQGSPLDGAVRVFNSARTEIRFDANGIPGVTATTTFDAAAGETYYILVEQVGANLGAYTLQVDSAPPVYHLYYPEGFTGSSIDEFVPMVNPNGFDVSYTIIARYEVGERDQVLSTGVIPANSRGGITISTRGGENPSGIRVGEPYAIEIQSSGQLGATLSHYDFGVTTGESFTERTSTLWTFSEAHKDAATFRDFLVFYNPSNVDAQVTVTLTYDDGTVNTFTRDLAALRRGGVNFNDDLSITKEGVFAVEVSSTVPVVAALSSYDIQNGRGFGLLGNPDGGAIEGVIPSISTGSGVESSLSIYNTGNTTATVTLRGTYQRADLPELVRVITVGANSRFSATMADLGLIDSQVAGIRYTSTSAVTVTAVQYRSGDGDATTAPTTAVTSALIGDAFVNPAIAGITYVEELALYNPSSIDVNITITFLFNDGTTGTYTNPIDGSSSINIAPDSFAFIRIDQEQAILSRPDLAFFSIRLDAPTPFVASFNHYDLFLNGGWGALPSPVGISVPLSRI